MDLLAIGGVSLDQIFSVDRLPERHFEGIIQGYGTYYGGRAPNVAAMAAKLGLQTGVVSPVGDDFHSSGYERHLRELGVDLRGIVCVAGERTKQILIFTDISGQQITFFYYGAESHFRDMQVPKDLIAESRLVHVSSSGDYKFNIRCAECAHAKGIPVSFDVGNDPFTEIPEYLSCLVPCTSYLFMNDVEVAGVLKRLEIHTIHDLLDHGPTTVTVINKRDKTSQIYTKDFTYGIPSAIGTVTDPTGTSDAYVAAFLTAMLRGYDLETAGKLGTCEASFIVEQAGCQTNLPNWNLLEQRCRTLFGIGL